MSNLVQRTASFAAPKPTFRNDLASSAAPPVFNVFDLPPGYKVVGAPGPQTFGTWGGATVGAAKIPAFPRKYVLTRDWNGTVANCGGANVRCAGATFTKGHKITGVEYDPGVVTTQADGGWTLPRPVGGAVVNIPMSFLKPDSPEGLPMIGSKPNDGVGKRKKYRVLEDVGGIQIQCIKAPCPPLVFAKKGEELDGILRADDCPAGCIYSVELIKNGATLKVDHNKVAEVGSGSLISSDAAKAGVAGMGTGVVLVFLLLIGGLFLIKDDIKTAFTS